MRRKNKTIMPMLFTERGRAGYGAALAGDESGFTLIETVLSLSILVVMIGLVLSSLRLGQRSMEKGEQALNDATARRFITKRVASDVTSMYLYSEKKYGQKTYLFSGAESDFAFVTTHRAGATGLPRGGTTFVRYAVGRGGLIVSEKTLPLMDAAQKQESRAFTLGPEVSRVSFMYLGDKGWVKKWNMASEQRLPLAVQAEFFFKSSLREPLVVLAPVWASHAPLAVTAPAPKGA